MQSRLTSYSVQLGREIIISLAAYMKLTQGQDDDDDGDGDSDDDDDDDGDVDILAFDFSTRIQKTDSPP